MVGEVGEGASGDIAADHRANDESVLRALMHGVETSIVREAGIDGSGDGGVGDVGGTASAIVGPIEGPRKSSF